MKLGTGIALSVLVFSSVGLAALAPPPASSAPASGWLGVSLGPQSSDPGTATTVESEGVKVLGVVHGSPAQKAGLRARDLILSVDGKAVSTPKDVIGIVSSLPPGSSLSLNVSRRGQERLVTPSLVERPSDASLMKMYDGWIGVEAIELPPALREHFGAPADSGVMVSSVKAGSPAEAAGIGVGDVLFEVEGEAVRSVASLRNLIASAGIDNRLEIRAMRDGAEIVIEPLVSARPERDDPQ